MGCRSLCAGAEAVGGRLVIPQKPFCKRCLCEGIANLHPIQPRTRNTKLLAEDQPLQSAPNTPANHPAATHSIARQHARSIA